MEQWGPRGIGKVYLDVVRLGLCKYQEGLSLKDGLGCFGMLVVLLWLRLMGAGGRCRLGELRSLLHNELVVGFRCVTTLTRFRCWRPQVCRMFKPSLTYLGELKQVPSLAERWLLWAKGQSAGMYWTHSRSRHRTVLWQVQVSLKAISSIDTAIYGIPQRH